MKRSPALNAFTLIEMIMVIAIIAILAGLVLSISGLVQRKGATARAESEIRALTTAMTSYSTDNGGFPQDSSITDTLDPRTSFDPSGPAYKNSSRFLYGELTGDTDYNGKINGTETDRKYAGDFFKTNRFDSTYRQAVNSGGSGTIAAFVDPFGNSYGYSTAGLKGEQDFRLKLQTNPSANRSGVAGYNPNFDLWSTGGSATSDVAKWVKNW